MADRAIACSLWLLWAHVAAMPIISLLFDQGPAQAALDCATVGVSAVLAQLQARQPARRSR